MNHDDYQGLAGALFEESNEALFLLDPQTGHILDANAAAQRLCGFSLRAVLDTLVGDLFQPCAGPAALVFPMPSRKANLPYAERGFLLRTFAASEVPVDVTITRLGVRPHQVALLCARETHGPSPEAAASGGSNRLRRVVA